MTMRYVHPAAEQQKTAAEKFEKFSAEGIISAAALQQRQRATTKVTVTREGELMTTTGKSLKELVDVTGIEPVTPCLQSRCSPS
jgi:uncharacterized protein YoaH (UPF0181 family)